MTYHQQVDPGEILGVRADAPLQEIREAYRARAKKYHPDLGGDAWAFRLVAWAYETLSTARVQARAAAEAAAAAPPRPQPVRTPTAKAAASGDERVRAGVHDEAADPSHVVDVELFLIRFEMESPFDLFSASPADRNLSCCLNVSWPSQGLDPRSVPDAASARILKDLAAAFEKAAGATVALDSQSTVRDGRFSGWLSYPTAIKTDEAFKVLHDALNARRLAVSQSTREVVIPRERR